MEKTEQQYMVPLEHERQTIQNRIVNWIPTIGLSHADEDLRETGMNWHAFINAIFNLCYLIQWDI